jgi:hypothetical protein
MKIERMTEIETSDIKVGDRIRVGHYTATCQEITPKGALFLLDQYLDKAYQMNRETPTRAATRRATCGKLCKATRCLRYLCGHPRLHGAVRQR